MPIPSFFPPTAAELEILHLLWQHGPATVRTLNERQNHEREVGYTTTLKLLQIMMEKRLVERESAEGGRQHVYKARVAEDATQRHLLDSFVETTFRGSASQLVLRALGPGTNPPPSQDELAQIRALLDNLENPAA